LASNIWLAFSVGLRFRDDLTGDVSMFVSFGGVAASGMLSLSSDVSMLGSFGGVNASGMLSLSGTLPL
jgi:hypothetical protein